MSDTKRLEEISERLGETMQRIDALQSRKKLPWTTRLRNHVGRNSSQLTNVVLAGCVLAVAAGRLTQQREHEVIQQHPAAVHVACNDRASSIAMWTG